MLDLLLTHGYYLYEDPKETQIMKPYAPLGILYLCSHLRQQGFNVEVFDTTFSSRQSLFHHLQTEKPSTLGIYANLMTRSNVVETIRVAREAGWRVIVGGPEPGAYAREYLESGAAEFVSSGRVSPPCKNCWPPCVDGSAKSGNSWIPKIAGTAYLDEQDKNSSEPSTHADRRPRRSALACPPGHRFASICRYMANSPSAGVGQLYHRAGMSL